MEYDINGSWKHVDGEGWQYTATAVTKAGRVVARTTVTLHYDVGYAVEDLHGSDGVAAIEQLAKELCEQSIVPE